MQTLHRKQITVPWSGVRVSRLCMGTAQLGMNYGIANQSGQPGHAEICRMLECAWESGIDLYDTAQVYGNCEEVLGKAFSELGFGSEVKVISKIHPSLEHAPAEEIIKAVQKSLSNLQIGKLFSLMLHREEWLKDWKRFERIFRQIGDAGFSESFGVSVYTLRGFENAMAIDAIKTIQMPFNLFDQRLRTENCFERAAKAGKMLFVRSVYLQGLLTMKDADAPAFAKPYMAKLSSAVDYVGLPVSQMAFQFAAQHSQDAALVFGAETFEQVKENIRLFHLPHAFSAKETEMLFDLGKDTPVKLIDPSQWAAA